MRCPHEAFIYCFEDSNPRSQLGLLRIAVVLERCVGGSAGTDPPA